MGFEVITSEKFVEIGAPKVAERIRNKVGDNPVYVSVDIDVLDPAFAPGILFSFKFISLISMFYKVLELLKLAVFRLVSCFIAFDSLMI